MLGLPWFGKSAGCAIVFDAYQRTTNAVRRVFDEASAASGVGVFRFDPYLCEGGACRTEMDGTILYRDKVHFTNAGAALLGRKIGFGDTLLRLAR